MDLSNNQLTAFSFSIERILSMPNMSPAVTTLSPSKAAPVTMFNYPPPDHRHHLINHQFNNNNFSNRYHLNYDKNNNNINNNISNNNNSNGSDRIVSFSDQEQLPVNPSHLHPHAMNNCQETSK